MSTYWSESEWRCPTDGGFHMLDLSQGDFNTDMLPCTKCGNLCTPGLVEDGMANTTGEAPKALLGSTLRVAPIYHVPALLTINDNKSGSMLVKVYFDGRLEYGPNYTPDAAAKRFWEALAFFAPHKKRVES